MYVSWLSEVSLILSRTSEFSLLSSYYRRELMSDLENSSHWYSLSLSLFASGAYVDAYRAFNECIKRDPTNIPALLMLTKICINHLDKAKKAVTHSSNALAVIKQQIKQASTSSHKLNGYTRSASTSPTASSSSFSSFSSSSSAPSSSASSSLLLTCLMSYGVACSFYAYQVSTFGSRKSLQKRALNALLEAHQLCPSHNLISFHLACIYADIREISSSLKIIRSSLSIDRTNARSWHLLSLLLSSNKKYIEAVKACDTAIQQQVAFQQNNNSDTHQQHSNSMQMISLLITKTTLLLTLEKREEAILTIQILCALAFKQEVIHVDAKKAKNRITIPKA